MSLGRVTVQSRSSLGAKIVYFGGMAKYLGENLITKFTSASKKQAKSFSFRKFFLSLQPKDCEKGLHLNIEQALCIRLAPSLHQKAEDL